MTKTPVRLAQPPSRQLLLQILDWPELARSLQALAPQHFTKLVRHVGLEDSGELLALASREQMELLLDEELWKIRRAGEDERFDADRFALWLEVLLEAGDEHAARRLSEIPEELLQLGFSRHALVIDIDALAVELSNADDPDENDQIEKALDSHLYHEIDQYRLIARRHSGWDAVIGALVALDRDHHDLVVRLLERCAAASSEYIDDNGGLYEVLTSEEMLESDAAAEREDRRAAAGFVSPASARSFLALARKESLDAILGATGRDPVTKAYFRELERPEERPARKLRSTKKHAELTHLLRDAGVLPETPAVPPLLATSTGDEAAFTQALAALRADEPALFAARMEELAFLANVLAVTDTARRPLPAIERAIAVCQRGLDHLLGEGATLERAIEAVREHGADKLFRIGWHLSGVRRVS